MFVIVEGQFSDWEIKGYVETEEEAQSICAEYNDRDRRFWGRSGEAYYSYEWYYVEAKQFNPITYDIKNIDSPTYELIDVVFKANNEFSYLDRNYMPYSKIKEDPKIIQEDEYCTAIRLRVDPKTSDEKIVKIAKDYLMQYKAEKEGIC